MRALGAADKGVDRTIENALVAVLSAFQQAILGRTPVGATGVLRSSLQPEIRRNPSGDELIGELLFQAPYAEAVETGDLHGEFPTPAELELWVVRKLGVASGKAAVSASHAVAASIKKKGGIRAARMVQDGVAAARSAAEDIFSGLADDIAAEMQKELNK